MVSWSPAEVVIGDVQRGRSGQVLDFLGEAEREPREPLHKRADRQIVAFNMAGHYRPQIPYAAYVGPARVHHIRWSVATDFGIDVILDENAMPSRLTERFADRGLIRRKAVRADLWRELASVHRGTHHAAFQVTDKRFRGFRRPSTERVGNHQFRVRVQRGEKVPVAKPTRTAFFLVEPCLFLFDERPDFIALNVLHRDIGQRKIVEFLASIPKPDQKPHDRVTMRPGVPFGATDGRTFHKHAENLNLPFA